MAKYNLHKEYDKQAKDLLRDLKSWIGTLPDEKLIKYIKSDLEIAHINGRIESIKKRWNYDKK
jgi:hypothetical protein